MPNPAEYRLLTMLQNPDKKSQGELRESIKTALKTGASRIPLFQPLAQFNHRSLYDFLKRNKKYKHFTLDDFIDLSIISTDEKDNDGRDLMEVLIDDAELDVIKHLLLHGVLLTAAAYERSQGEIRTFFDYQPGHGEKTIKQFVSLRVVNNRRQQLQALIWDQQETTDAESSDAIATEDEALSTDDEQTLVATTQQLLQARSAGDHSHDGKIRMIGYRGMHFSPAYFNEDQRLHVENTRDQAHTTFSVSTQYDAGYDADDEPEEDDVAILAQHRRIMDDKARLQASPDRKERAVRGRKPAKSRNDIQFDNLLLRFIQAYINSYSSMFDHDFVRQNFGFTSKKNPLVSISWLASKGMSYASGGRFGWKGGNQRRDPHYRRSTGKPKHPNLGFVDVYSFDPEYVAGAAFDRYLLFLDRKIHLSNVFQYEAEAIFFSMIEKEHHVYRFMVSAPRFDRAYDANQDRRSGIATKSVHTRWKNEFLKLGPKSTDYQAYRDLVDRVIQSSVKAQSASLEKKMRYRLFHDDQVPVFRAADANLVARLPNPAA